MDEIIQFRSLLPPAGANQRGALPPCRTTPGGLILHALIPLQDELDAALARNDRSGAAQLAYGALTAVADALAAGRGDQIRPGQVRVHALLVELEPLPLESQLDGTLAERGTAVTVNYRNWVVEQAVAATWAQNLADRFQTLWPGAWVVVGE